MRNHAMALLAGSAVLCGLAQGARADIVVPLGMGWQAVLATNNVTLTVTPSTDGILHLRKFATFSVIDPSTGAPEPVLITFQQILPDALTASQIIIDDEQLMNLTGVTWTGYRQFVSLSNNVAFDAATLGMSVGPQFTTNTLSNSNRELMSNGGAGVLSGTAWTPGVVSGGLVININLGGQESPVAFVLKELPVPVPGAAAVAGLGALAAARRRR